MGLLVVASEEIKQKAHRIRTSLIIVPVRVRRTQCAEDTLFWAAGTGLQISADLHS